VRVRVGVRVRVRVRVRIKVSGRGRVRVRVRVRVNTWGWVSTITEPSGTLGLNGEQRQSSEPVGDGVGGAPKSDEERHPPVGASGEGGRLVMVRVGRRVRGCALALGTRSLA
jgi:hypothetical protein